MKVERVLNVGCGGKLEGTDFLDLYPRNPKVVRYDADRDKMPYKDSAFERVLALNLLEHLRNPENFFKESYRVLKKGGVLYILTDNAGFYGWFGMVHYGGYADSQRREDRHYAIFTRYHLENWLRTYGFKNINVSYSVGWSHTFAKGIVINALAGLNKRFSPHIIAEGMK